VLPTEADLAALSRHLGLDERELIQRFCVLARNRAQLALAEKADGSCVFLDGNDCRVYPARPLQCRQFPSAWFVPGCPAVESMRATSSDTGGGGNGR